MSSAIGAKQATQTSVMKECSEKGGNILAALSNNSSCQSEISIKGTPLSEQDAILKSTSNEHYVSQETLQWLISTHQCHQSRARLHEGNEVTWSSTSSHREMHLAAKEMEKSPKDIVFHDILPPADQETPFSDLSSNLAQGGTVEDESEGLFKIDDVGMRNSPLRSILKKPRMTPGSMTLDLECVSHDTSDHQTIFNDTEVAPKSKMVNNEMDSPRKLIVFIPTSKHRKMSKKHIVQLAAMSGCGFILVALIVAWVFSPTFL